MKKVQNYLKQAYRLNELIASNQQELCDLRLLSESIPGTDYSKERVQTSPSGEARFEKFVEKIVALEDAINEDTEHLLTLKLEIRTVINEVKDNEERLLLKLRYLNFMSWDDICDQLNVSMRTAHRIHTSALEHVKVPEYF